MSVLFTYIVMQIFNIRNSCFATSPKFVEWVIQFA